MAEPNKIAIERAIDLILKKYGSLRDLAEEFAQIVWITAYLASIIGLKIETGNGSKALLKIMLADGGRDAKEFDSRTRQLQFVEGMVPIARSTKGGVRMEDA